MAILDVRPLDSEAQGVHDHLNEVRLYNYCLEVRFFADLFFDQLLFYLFLHLIHSVVGVDLVDQSVPLFGSLRIELI